MEILKKAPMEQIDEYAKKLIGVGSDNPPQVYFSNNGKDYYFSFHKKYDGEHWSFGDWSVEIKEGLEYLINEMELMIMSFYEDCVLNVLAEQKSKEDITNTSAIIRDVRTRIPDYLRGQIDEEKFGL